MKEISFIKKFDEYNTDYYKGRWEFKFPNGYGASVINYGYGAEERIV